LRSAKRVQVSNALARSEAGAGFEWPAPRKAAHSDPESWSSAPVVRFERGLVHFSFILIP
ncbi:hypothetical protein, partial [Paenibacillus pasadenensis]|uniref:hypothetical protein n=1 Tax=Paenibacillus pasadenensis TaxID=217090 RepID=UPI001C3F73FD